MTLRIAERWFGVAAVVAASQFAYDVLRYLGAASTSHCSKSL